MIGAYDIKEEMPQFYAQLIEWTREYKQGKPLGKHVKEAQDIAAGMVRTSAIEEFIEQDPVRIAWQQCTTVHRYLEGRTMSIMNPESPDMDMGIEYSLLVAEMVRDGVIVKAPDGFFTWLAAGAHEYVMSKFINLTKYNYHEFARTGIKDVETEYKTDLSLVNATLEACPETAMWRDCSQPRWIYSGGTHTFFSVGNRFFDCVYDGRNGQLIEECIGNKTDRWFVYGYGNSLK